jgi:hypothetical protein
MRTGHAKRVGDVAVDSLPMTDIEQGLEPWTAAPYHYESVNACACEQSTVNNIWEAGGSDYRKVVGYVFCRKRLADSSHAIYMAA